MTYGVHLIFGEDFASQNFCFALKYVGASLEVGIAEGISDTQEIIKEARKMGVQEVVLRPLSLNEIKRLINSYYSIELKEKEIFERIRLYIREERFEDLFLYIMENASDLSASDVHIFAEEPYLMIRLRIRGRLVTFCVLDSKLLPTLGRIIKVRGNVDISRSLRPIDGRMELMTNQSLDIRFSIVNTIHGEKYSLRLLDNENIPRSVNELGISEEEINQIRNMLLRESGTLLVTGPTGSGKSTTVRCFFG